MVQHIEKGKENWPYNQFQCGLPQRCTTEDNVPYFAVDSLNYNANLEYFGTDRNKYLEGRAISSNALSEPSPTFAEWLFSSPKYPDILNKYYWLITSRQSESSNTVELCGFWRRFLSLVLEARFLARRGFFNLNDNDFVRDNGDGNDDYKEDYEEDSNVGDHEVDATNPPRTLHHFPLKGPCNHI